MAVGLETRSSCRSELSFGGREIAIIQKPEIVAARRLDELRGKTIDTTTVVVPGVAVEERDEVLGLLHKLSWLLSLGTGSNVALHR
jgi:hypothetical protein